MLRILNGYLAEVNEQAENMMDMLMKDMAEKEGITETLKAENQMEWVRRMNTVWGKTMKIVNEELIYS
jgi:phosphoribosyl-AMP cyclohydrolase